MRKAIAALSTALCIGSFHPALAAFDDNAPIAVTTTGALQQGFFTVVIETMHSIFRDAYPGTTATFMPNSVGGGVLAVAGKTADISIGVPTPELRRAMTGEKPFTQPLQGKLLHVMTILNELDFVWLADKGWAEKNKIATFADVAKVKPATRFGAGATATFYTDVGFEAVTKQYGFDIKELASWGGRVYHTNLKVKMDDLRDGKLDFVTAAASQPDQIIDQAARVRDLVWIGTERSVLEKAAKEADMEVATIKAGSYNFLDKDVLTLRVPTVTAAGAHVPEETVYKMLKAIEANLDRLRAAHPVYRTLTMEKLAKPTPAMPYHPGAEKYYRERGLIK